MSKGKFFIDDTQVKEMLLALSGEELKRVSLSALRKGAVILQRQTEANVKEKIKIGSNRETVTRKSGKRVNKIRRIAAIKVSKKDMTVKVHIMSDFRIKFFEMGTRLRKTSGHKIAGFRKKGNRKYAVRSGRGGSRGTIKPGWFFRRAKDQTEKQIFDNMDKELGDAIVRISKRK